MLTLKRHKTLDPRIAALPVIFLGGYLLSFAVLTRLNPVTLGTQSQTTITATTPKPAPTTGSTVLSAPMSLPVIMGMNTTGTPNQSASVMGAMAFITGSSPEQTGSAVGANPVAEAPGMGGGAASNSNGMQGGSSTSQSSNGGSGLSSGTPTVVPPQSTAPMTNQPATTSSGSTVNSEPTSASCVNTAPAGCVVTVDLNGPTRSR